MCKRIVCLAPIALALGMLLSTRSEAVDPDLIGYWKLDETAGPTAQDASGNGNDGTLNGDPQWVAGRLGGALEFDGDGDYVDIGNDPIFNVTGDITVACWIRVSQFTVGWQAIFTMGDDSWRLQRQTTTDTLCWACSGVTGTPGNWWLNGDVNVNDGEWHHAAGVYDGSKYYLYVDGDLDASKDASGTINASSYPVFIGGNAQQGGREFEGLIDDVRIYKRALMDTEIPGVMSGGGAEYPLAFGPDPANGAMLEATSVNLGWRAGDYAASHDVYFGGSLEDVNQATPESDTFQGNQTETAFPVQDLTPGTTYYWRVDEVNDANATSPWKGDVWSFWVQPARAWAPSPADGVKYVLPDHALTWQNGMGTLFHTVYFGESYDEVSEAVSGGWMIADALYEPGPLETGKTYYWRVDEFTMTGTVAGETWSFTMLPEMPLAEDPNLMLWWTLTEGMGGTAVDWSGHGNHGSLRGDLQWIDGALTFDGRNDYLSVLLDVSETEYTAALWFKTTSADCGLMAVVQDDLGGGGHDRHVYLTGGNIKIRLWDTEEIESAGLNLADAQWHHVVYTYGASVGGQKLYVDGVLQASGIKDTSDFDWQERVNIGFSNDGAPPYFGGVLQDVRIYDRTLSAEEVQQLMRGDPLLAWNPQPSRGATVDVRDATALSWSAGDTAVSHDVYLGTDRDAVAAAGPDAAEYRGSQPDTSFALGGLLEFGGGAYYWRIDEVETDGTVHAGNIWTFTIPDYLIVDDFESYTNEVGSRLFEVWIDGVGYTLPEPGHPGNGSGAVVGHDIWSVDSPYFGRTIVETDDVHGGGRAMPIYYDNTFAPARSQADRTFTPGQNWTVEGVTTLVVHFRGEANNTGDMYVEINGVKVPYHGDPADIASRGWIAWEIDLASVGVSLTNITTLTIGIEGGQTGVLYVDDIILTKP